MPTHSSISELPWWNIIFFVLAIIGIFFTIYYYNKSKIEKKPYYNSNTFSLVRNDLTKLKNIEIRYKDRNITELSMTKFAFWNGGKKPIRKEDITSKDPLLITTLNKHLIYDIEVTYSKSPNNFFAEILDDQTISLNFDYLNYNDGATLKIFHSGRYKDLKISGTFIGSNSIGVGIKKDMWSNKIDDFFDYVASFLEKTFGKWKVLYIIGIPLLLLWLLIMIVLMIIVTPLNFFYNMSHKTPKEFTFEI